MMVSCSHGRILPGRKSHRHHVDDVRVCAVAMVAIVLTVVVSYLSYAQSSIILSPMLVTLSVPSGTVAEFDIGLTNQGVVGTSEFRVYAADVRQDISGDYRVTEPGSTPGSCASWIELSQDRITLGSGQATSVRGRIKVPRGVYGGRYAAVVFELVPETKQDQEATVSAVFMTRFVTVVELTVPSPRIVKSLAVSAFNVRQGSNDPQLASAYGRDAVMLTADVTNNGDIHVFTEGTMILRDANGRRLTQFPMGGGRGIVIPQASIGLSAILPSGLPAGSYTADVQIKYGGIRPATAKVAFTIGGTEGIASELASERIVPFTVSPSHLDFSYPAGATAVGTLMIENKSDERIDVTGFATSLAYDIDGEMVMEELADDENSCADWVELRPSDFQIAPWSKQVVRVLIPTPKTCTGSRYASLIFRAKPASESADDDPSRAQGEAGATVFLTVGKDIKKAGELEPILILRIGQSAGFVFATSFTNTGNTHVNLQAKVSLKKRVMPTLDPGIEYVGRGTLTDVFTSDVDMAETPVLPGGMRLIDASYPGTLEPGDYVVEFVINYGGTSPLYVAQDFAVE